MPGCRSFPSVRLDPSKAPSLGQQYEARRLTDDTTLCLASFFLYKCRSRLSSLGPVTEAYARLYALSGLNLIASVSRAPYVLEKFGIFMDRISIYSTSSENLGGYDSRQEQR
jgi:hypothetical protein